MNPKTIILCVLSIWQINMVISIADVTTGDYYVTEVDSERKLIDEINKFAPSEIICNESFYMSRRGSRRYEKPSRNRRVSALDAWYFVMRQCRRTLKDHFKVRVLEGLGLK